ncbi:MAG TPA: hypothetical protein VF720_10320 [Candidatus Eisenbacteria bacterium]
MRPRSIHRQSSPALVVATIAVTISLAGCGTHDAPVAPKAGFEDAGTTTPLPPAEAIAARRPETIDAIDAEDVSRTQIIRAASGGVITAGRHRLTIPPGALKQDTSIQLKDVSGSEGYVACEAYPEGLTFEKPVLLETFIGDIKNPFGYTIFWIANPGKSNENWVDMQATVTPDGQSLEAWLSHFSSYAPGKAGWTPRRGVPGHFRNEG